jgi:hypothetical protein
MIPTLKLGLVGGFLASLAMAGVVRLPDALCLAIAKQIGATGLTLMVVGMMFHLTTGLTVGGIFGLILARLRTYSRQSCITLGLLAGVIVWAAFFSPLSAELTPAIVSYNFITTALLSHFVFGLVMGGTVAGLSSIRLGKPTRI